MVCSAPPLQTPLANGTRPGRPCPGPDTASGRPEQGPALQEAPGATLSTALSPEGAALGSISLSHTRTRSPHVPGDCSQRGEDRMSEQDGAGARAPG